MRFVINKDLVDRMGIIPILLNTGKDKNKETV